MKIKEGEYVRTNEGEIAKVIKIEKRKKLEDKIFLDINMEYFIYNFDIKVHSKNIIDLIEVGDYVNNYRVVDIMEDMETGEIHLEMTADYTNPEIGDCTIYNKDIKTIVTRELYEQDSYKVVE